MKIKSFTLVLVLWAFLWSMALAGIVEDAEDELKKIRKDQKATRLNAKSSVESPPQRAPGRDEQDAGTQKRVEPRGAADDSSQKLAVSAKPMPTGERAKGKPVKKRVDLARRKSDRLLSIFGVLFLLILVGAATVYGTRSSGDNEPILS